MWCASEGLAASSSSMVCCDLSAEEAVGGDGDDIVADNFVKTGVTYCTLSSIKGGGSTVLACKCISAYAPVVCAGKNYTLFLQTVKNNNCYVILYTYSILENFLGL